MASLLVVLSFLIFSLMYIAPGDVVRNLLGTRAATPEAVAAVRNRYNLDDPFLVQYGKWLANAVRGDFGLSVETGTPVTQLFGERLGVTLLLAAIAMALAIGVGIPLGIVAAQRHNSGVDRWIVGLSIVGISAPGFALGLLFLYVFAVMLGWFPMYGMGEPGLDRLWHLALPALALACGVGATVVKITRTSVLRELNEDYVTFARSRGISQGAIRRSYLRNASIPIVTSVGLILAALFGGSVLIEKTFALPGLGVLLADSIMFKDIPVVQALTLIVAVLIAASTAAADFVAVALDPRVRARRLAVRT